MPPSFPTVRSSVRPTTAADWQLWHPVVPERLRTLHAEGYRLVMFTNQKVNPTGLSREARIQRVEQALSTIGAPFDVFMAFEDDVFRDRKSTRLNSSH